MRILCSKECSQPHKSRLLGGGTTDSRCLSGTTGFRLIRRHELNSGIDKHAFRSLVMPSADRYDIPVIRSPAIRQLHVCSYEVSVHAAERSACLPPTFGVVSPMLDPTSTCAHPVTGTPQINYYMVGIHAGHSIPPPATHCGW